MQNQKIKHFQKRLLDWFSIHCRPLPWRNTTDPYCVWISEVMLQQTQVKTVLPYYSKFLFRFPDVRYLARADLQDVLKMWEGLGYYARAHNLHKSAGIIINAYGGILPNDVGLLRELPGVGEYIASAVLSIAYGQPYAAVDGNVKRLLARLYKSEVPVNRPASNHALNEAAEKLLEKNDPGRFNQALMELGALVCTPKSPKCSCCPVIEFCRALRTNAVNQYPRRIKKTKIPQFHIATGVVFKGGRVLITQRKRKGLLGGLWEFPGGKVKKGETAQSACVREIKEETNLRVQTQEHITRIRHAYSHFKIIMDVFNCRYLDGRVHLKSPVEFRWVPLSELDKYPFPGANRKFIPLVKNRFGDN